MNNTAIGRALIGDSLGFHLLFVTFGVGLPILVSLLELYSLVTKRPRARELAHTWSRALVILFIAGAVSGTVISLQFSLIWPYFVKFADKVIGISFALEGYFFLIEALFLSIYMLSWNKFKPWAHWLLSLPVVLGSLGSAFFITTVNGFMNTPRGFSLDSAGNPINIHVWQAVFNPAAFSEIMHSISGYLFTSALVLLAVHAWPFIRKTKPNRRDLRLLTGLAICAFVFGLMVAATGDHNGKTIATYEPLKLAAAEGLEHTQTHAPLTIGGLPDANGHLTHGVTIPGLLSFLATGNINGQVKGLQDFPPSNHPSVIVHYFFDGMVGIGFFTIGVVALFLLLRTWRPSWSASRPMLWLLVVSAALSMVALEFGWLLTELGRQPYVIYGVMKVPDAITTSHEVISLGFIFPTLYLVLLVVTVLTLKRSFATTKGLKHA